MNLLEIIIIGISLGMDSFAVAVGKGLSMFKMNWKKALIIGLYFGSFQAGMTGIGFLLGAGFPTKILAINYWIAFILLFIIGINMIKEAISNKQENINDDIGIKTMIILSIATSIDALAVGVRFRIFKN